MTVLLWLTRTALVGACVSAVLLSRRRREHSPVAVFLTAIAAAAIVRPILLERFGLIRPLDAQPLVGAARAAFHVDEALFLLWACGLAAVALAVFLSRRWVWIPAVAWVATSAILVIYYPEIRGDRLRDVYAAAEIAAICIGIGSIVHWTWRREPPGPEHVAGLLFVLIDAAATVAGSLRWGLWSRYDLDQIASAITFTLLTVFQGYAWQLQRSR